MVVGSPLHDAEGLRNAGEVYVFDSDGSLLFTISSWLGKCQSDWDQTLNVVSVAEDQATVEWAIDVKYNEFRVLDDTALVSIIRTNSVFDEEGTEHQLKETYLVHVDLTAAVVKWVYRFDGAAQLAYAGSDVAFVCRPGENEMLVVDLLDHSGAAITDVPLAWFGYGVVREGNVIYCPLGMNGVQTVWLKLFDLPW